jgi:hypothetical protein
MFRELFDLPKNTTEYNKHLPELLYEYLLTVGLLDDSEHIVSRTTQDGADDYSRIRISVQNDESSSDKFVLIFIVKPCANDISQYEISFRDKTWLASSYTETSGRTYRDGKVAGMSFDERVDYTAELVNAVIKELDGILQFLNAAKKRMSLKYRA